MKSSTRSLAFQCPTTGPSVEHSPRMTGASTAARSSRSCSGSAAKPSRTGPSGSASPWVAMYSAARPISSSDVARHSSDPVPQAVSPWPPSTTPRSSGRSRCRRASRRPRSNPGRIHGTQATSSP